MTFGRLGSLGAGFGLGSPGGVSAGSLAIGSIANRAFTGYPQARKIGSYVYLPIVDNNGRQYLHEIDAASGSLHDTLLVSSTYIGTEDDHLNFAFLQTNTGALLTAFCGHNAVAEMRFRRSADGTLAGFGAEFSAATADKSTYPQLFLHASTGHIYLLYRSSLFRWAMMKSTDDGLTWTDLPQFVTSANQMYCHAAWCTADKLRIIGHNNQTATNSNLYIAEFDVGTGDLISGSGTLGNLYTPTGLPTTLTSAWSLFHDPVQFFSSAIHNMSEDGTQIAFAVVTNDQYFEEYWYAKLTGASQFTASNWTKTKVCDGYYGLGDKALYRWTGRHSLSFESGLSTPRMYLARLLRGNSFVERFDADNINGTAWKQTMSYDSQLMGLSDGVHRPYGVYGANSTLPFYYMGDTYRDTSDYDSSVRWPIIRASTSAPSLLVATSYSTPEWRAFEITLSANQPCGWHIVGGSDQTKFQCQGNRLFLQAKSFAAPSDANTDNTYEVTVRATALSGQTADFNFTVVVTSATIAPANLLLFSQVFTNAAWTASGLTLAQDTAETTDPLGTNLACKWTQAATTAIHRIEQTVSVTSGQRYTLSAYAKYNSAKLIALNLFDGVTNFGATFDLLYGFNMVAPRDSGGTIEQYGMFPISGQTGWARIWIEFIAGNTSAAALAQIVGKVGGGSSMSEIGSTGNNGYIFGAMLNQGALGTYAARTT